MNNVNMGGTCSLGRRRQIIMNQDSNNDIMTNESINEMKTLCRHSIKSELPDESIAALYPVEDNYVVDAGGSTRSPKSLVDLCIDTICRNLPLIEGGDLPHGIPQDLVDRILDSLVSHSALNSTTLKSLRNCELSELPLSRSRGVSDDWLISLKNDQSEKVNIGTTSKKEGAKSEEQDTNSCRSLSSSDSSSFHSAVSTQRMLSDTKLSSSINLPIEQKMELSVTANITLLDLRGSQQVTDKGLLQLNDLRSLEVARFDNCYSIIGKGLLALSNSHQLHTLSLSNCRCLTDEAITNISNLSSIEILSLDGCRCITDISLEGIANLYNLQKLELSQCDLITDDGIEHLQSLMYLEELSLGWCRMITDTGFERLTSQPNRGEFLLSLSLARCQITDVGIAYLDRLSSLNALDLNGCSHIGSVALGNALQGLKNLETLDVSYCPHIIRSSWQGKINSLRSIDLCYSGVKNSHLSHWSSLPSLEELNLDSCLIGDWSLAHLADNNVVPNLKSLDLADTDISDRALIHIAKLSKLEHLSLFYCEITNNGLRHLSQLESLQSLNLDSRDIGDNGMYYLRNLKNLKCLDVFSGRITDVGCTHIGKITSLESLELCGGGVGDFGCQQLSQLTNLTSLNLSQNERITNIGVSSLSQLKKLKALNLSNTSVTSEALPYFKSLLHLQSLAMYGCKGLLNSSTEMVSLQRDLPNLKCMRLRVAFDGDGTIDEGENEEIDEENVSMLDEEDDIEEDDNPHEGMNFEDENSNRDSDMSFFQDDDLEFDEDNEDDEDSLWSDDNQEEDEIGENNEV